MWAKNNDSCKAEQLNCLLFSMYSSIVTVDPRAFALSRSQIRTFYEKKSALIQTYKSGTTGRQIWA
jgi:hypothetical protein